MARAKGGGHQPMTNSFYSDGKCGRVGENEKRALEFPPEFSTRVFFSEPVGLASVIDFPPDFNALNGRPSDFEFYGHRSA